MTYEHGVFGWIELFRIRGHMIQRLQALGLGHAAFGRQDPGKIILGTGKVVANIDTPPSGGCRTSVELEMDSVADPRDCKGFHQPFILGRLDRLFSAYCQLAGIEVVPIA